MSLPLTAWEQAVVVAIFAVLLVLLGRAFIGAVGKMLTEQRESQLESQKSLLQQQQDFIVKRDEQFLGSLSDMNKKWQDFLDTERCNERERLDAFIKQTNEELSELAKAVKELTRHFDTFADRVDAHIVAEEARTEEARKHG